MDARLIKYILLTLLLLMLCVPAYGAEKYMKPIGEGDSTGTNFANAMSWDNPSFAADDTIYIAGLGVDSTYSPTTIDQDSLTFLKVTSAQSGITGYVAKYADSTAVFDAPLMWQSSNSVFDGISGSDSTRSGYGFVIDPVLPQTANIKGLAIPSTTPFVQVKVQNTTFRHVYIKMTGDTENGQIYGANTLYLIPHEDYYAEDLRFEHCYFGYGCGFNWLVSNFQGIYADSCMFSDNESNDTHHGEHISTQGKYAYACTLNACVFVQTEVYVVGFHGNEDGSTPNQDWVSVNCVHYKSKGTLTAGYGTADSGQENIIQNFKLIHGTFVDMAFGSGGVVEPGTTDAGNVATYKATSRNNLYYKCTNPDNYANYTDGMVDDDYNGYFACTGIDSLRTHDTLKSGDPFTDYASLDFSLSSTSYAIAEGDSTDIVSVSPYDTDINGVSRPAGTEDYPDMGAFETDSAQPGASAVADTIEAFEDAHTIAGEYQSERNLSGEYVNIQGEPSWGESHAQYAFIMPEGFSGTINEAWIIGETYINKSGTRQFKIVLQDGYTAVTDASSFNTARADTAGTGSISWTPASAFTAGEDYNTDDVASLLTSLSPSAGDTVQFFIEDDGCAANEYWWMYATEDPDDEPPRLYLSYTANSVTVDYPNGGEALEPGITSYFAATTAGVDTVIAYLSTDNGATWAVQDTFAIADSPVDWVVPDENSDSCLVALKSLADTTVADTSSTVFSIKTAPTVTAPDGGESWTVGTTENITYAAGDADSVKIEWSNDYGGNWTVIVESEEATGTHSWTVPDSVTTEGLVKISNAENTEYSDQSDAVFTIEAAEAEATITVTAPNGGETLTVGTPYTIQFTSASVDYVRITWSYDNGATWQVIEGAGVAATGTHTWSPDVATVIGLVRIHDYDSPATVFDTSDAVFTVEIATTSTGSDPKSVGVVALTITALLGTGYAAYRRYRGTHKP